MNHLQSILFKKQLNFAEENSERQWLPNNYTHWVALGHFDDIFIYELDSTNGFLENIQKDKRNVFEHSNDHTYYHTLHLVPSNFKNNYNNNNEWFIAIVRIHFTRSLKLTEQFDELRSELTKVLSASNLPFQIHYATEFSDMVIDVRSKNFQKLLRVVLEFRRTKKIEIGKMYTYFGINVEFLKDTQLVPAKNDKIPMFSMRFSGYNMDIVKKQVELIKKHLGNAPDLEYSINGIDDLLLIYKDLKTYDLVKFYRTWLFDNSFFDYRKSESTTKLGVKICTETTEFHQFIPDKELIESQICADIPDLCEKIKQSILHKKTNTCCTNDISDDFGWFHSISEIANSLVRMSKTPIMDEIVYLLAPGIRAFLINIYKKIDSPYNNEYFYTYAESCSYFIEQLARIEGQLSYHPEIRPVIYDIPVFMLEYTVAFLNKVSYLLKKNDGEKSSLNTVFLIVPRPCELMSAAEIFSATKDTPGLVHLIIPESTLYNPKEIFLELCHEISHYVGEKFRMREQRKSYYALAAAALATKCFFNSNQKDLIFMFQKQILNALNINAYNEPTISEMHGVVISTVNELIGAQDGMTSFIKTYYQTMSTKDYTPSPIKILGDDRIAFGTLEFERYILDLNILFREVFADLCMLSILQINHSDYIKMLLSELTTHEENERITNDAFAIRIFVCSVALGKSLEYDKKEYIETWEKISVIINKYKDEIREHIAGKYSLDIPTNSVVALLKYAQECAKTIETSLSRTDTDVVSKMYEQLSNDILQYREILEEIEQCRAYMINKE